MNVDRTNERTNDANRGVRTGRTNTSLTISSSSNCGKLNLLVARPIHRERSVVGETAGLTSSVLELASACCSGPVPEHDAVRRGIEAERVVVPSTPEAARLAGARDAPAARESRRGGETAGGSPTPTPPRRPPPPPRRARRPRRSLRRRPRQRPRRRPRQRPVGLLHDRVEEVLRRGAVGLRVFIAAPRHRLPPPPLTPPFPPRSFSALARRPFAPRGPRFAPAALVAPELARALALAAFSAGASSISVGGRMQLRRMRDWRSSRMNTRSWDRYRRARGSTRTSRAAAPGEATR